MTVSVNSTVGDSAIGLLLEQLKGKEGFEALVRALVGDNDTRGVQELEYALRDLLAMRLATDRGAQLDFWGAMVGCKRTSESNDRYRREIYLQIAINTSQGDPARLISICKQLSAATLVHYIRKGFGSATIYNHFAQDVTRLSLVEGAAEASGRVVVTACTTEYPFVFGKDMDTAGTEFGDELLYGEGFAEYVP